MKGSLCAGFFPPLPQNKLLNPRPVETIGSGVPIVGPGAGHGGSLRGSVRQGLPEQPRMMSALPAAAAAAGAAAAALCSRRSLVSGAR